MCTSCGCNGSPPLSDVERVKSSSNGLRGTLAEELAAPTLAFSDDATQVLKFHGVYQQDDRDLRKEARRLGREKHHVMMVRTRIPGGVVPADSYLAHQRVADEWGNGSLRVTTRQDFQLHGVLKGNLRSAIRAVNDGLLTTLGGCGDQERNIMFCAAPLHDRLRDAVTAALPGLVTALTPTTRAYVEIWLDGELASSTQPEPADPLYGDAYLPRKFKTALAVEGDNCVDIYANDLGLVARAGTDGGLRGFEVLVGGGLGRTANKSHTFPAVAKPLGFVPPEQLEAVARAVIEVQRDWGSRSDRRHARLKYLIHDRGIAWFREQVEARLGATLADPAPLTWHGVDDHLGWHPQGDGRFFYGLFVENGRIADREDGVHLRSALLELVSTLRCEVRLTAQQNLLLTSLAENDREHVLSVLARHGVTPSDEVGTTLRTSMACPAWPTCGLAVAESERVLPSLIREIAVVQERAGVGDVAISHRMTGCPNGCARPYLGDVGFVGTTLGKYDMYLGGDADGTRLNELYAHNVRLEDIPALLEQPFEDFARTRRPGESFGDWCRRQGVQRMAARLVTDPETNTPRVVARAGAT